MTHIAYLFILPLLSFVAGLVYSYEFRKLLARMQYRRGPYFIMPQDLRKELGTNRLWQSLYDIIKLWHKQTLIQESSSKTWFILSPIIALLLAVMSTWFLVIPGFNSPLGWTPLSVVTVFMILAFIPVFWVVGAASSGSPWALIGARREAELFLAYEIPLISAIISVAILANDLTIRVESYLAGFETLFMLSFRYREEVMDAIELLSGNRVLMDIHDIGGVRRDVSDEALTKIRGRLRSLRELSPRI